MENQSQINHRNNILRTSQFCSKYKQRVEIKAEKNGQNKLANINIRRKSAAESFETQIFCSSIM